LTSNNLEFEFSTKFWVKTYAYCIQLYKTARFDSFLTSLTQVWPLMTFYGLIWSQIILNFNSRQNSESKHMYIGYISTNRADLTPNWTDLTQVWPLMTLIDLENIKSEFLRKFRVETYVYWIYLDQPGRFDPELDGFDPSLTSGDPNWPWKY